MSYLKFNHVFFGLLFLAFLSAFVLSPRVSSHAQANVGALFTPVAAPVRWTMSRVHDTLAGSSPRDDADPARPRSSGDVLVENAVLRNEVARLTVQLARLEQINNERERLRDLRPLCTPYQVVGADSGVRQSIQLQATATDGLRDGMCAICPDGLVGRVTAGVAGARVQLITDPKSTLTVVFGKFTSGADGAGPFKILDLPQTVAQGSGNGQLVARLLPMQDVKQQKLTENDWAILDDGDGFPAAVQGIRVGRVVSIKPRSDAPGHAEIRIEPAVNLLQLREVMVVNKDVR